MTDLHLYLDISMSMRAFAKPADSRYRLVWKALFQNIGTTGVRFRRDGDFIFDTDVRNRELTQAVIEDTNLYTGEHTDLVKLFRRIAADSARNALHLIVSDMVQSQSQTGKTQVDLIPAFRDLAQTLPHILLLGIRSEYRGLYYIETTTETGKPKGTHFYNYQLRSGTDGRPFYILLVATSASVLDAARKGIMQDLAQVEEFRPAMVPYTVDTVLVADASVTGSMWDAYQNREQLRRQASGVCEYCNYLYDLHGEDGPLRLSYVLHSRFVEQDSADFRMSIAQRGRKDSVLQSVNPAAIVSSLGRQRDTLTIDYRFPRVVKPEKTRVYRVQVRPGEFNLTAPEWLTEWSTDDDRVYGNGNKTLNLDKLATSMIRATSEHMAFLDQYFLLER